MFLKYFLTFAKSQPNVSYKNTSYKKKTTCISMKEDIIQGVSKNLEIGY